MFSSLVFWSSFVGLVFLLAGLFLIRKDMTSAVGLNQVVLLAYPFVAAPLAAFSMQHLLAAHDLMQMVPSWIPAPLFWAYFVGIGLFAAALSFTVRRYVHWSALLLAIMFYIFVATMDIPGAIANPKNRIAWSLMFRETAFAGGALALAGAARLQESVRLSNAMIAIGRTCVAVTLLFYSFEHFAFPKSAPGVPLPKMTPNWVPVPELWAYAVGVILLIAGAAMFFNRRTRTAAAAVGLVMTFLTIALFFPLYVKALGTAQGLEEFNYVADTLFFGGTVLCIGIAAKQARRPEIG